jgi:uncharacterized RDD family membrane protein YckC
MIPASAGTFAPMTYVGVGRRFVAIFVDSVLLAIMSGPFAEIQHGAGYWQIGWHGRHLFWPGLIAIVYYVVLEGIAGGTIGKFMTGIRVVNTDGTKLGWPGSIVRNVARVVDGFPFALPYLVGAVSVWSSPTKQRLGDRWASTVVVTKDSLDAAVAGTSVIGAGTGRQHVATPPADVPPLPPPPPMPPSASPGSD